MESEYSSDRFLLLFLDDMRRVESIKGQTGKAQRSLTAVSDRRAQIVAALGQCPVIEWVNPDDLKRYMIARGQTFDVRRSPESLYDFLTQVSADALPKTVEQFFADCRSRSQSLPSSKDTSDPFPRQCADPSKRWPLGAGLRSSHRSARCPRPKSRSGLGGDRSLCRASQKSRTHPHLPPQYPQHLACPCRRRTIFAHHLCDRPGRSRPAQAGAADGKLSGRRSGRLPDRG